jgi:hypothetical protein
LARELLDITPAQAKKVTDDIRSAEAEEVAA